jgi:hypothetical protein
LIKQRFRLTDLGIYQHIYQQKSMVFDITIALAIA